MSAEIVPLRSEPATCLTCGAKFRVADGQAPACPSCGESLVGPHLQGQARCLACRHEWQAVAPIGTFDLECPSCGLMRGAWTFPVVAPAGTVVWRCRCGCEHMFVTPVNVMCAGCGQEADFPK